MGHQRWRRTFGVAAGAALAVVLIAGRGSSQTAVPGSSSALNPAQQIAAAHGGVLRLAMAADPPFTFLDTNGNFTSMMPALVQGFCTWAKVKCEYVPATYTTIVAGLQADKYQWIGADLHATPARREVIDFTVPFSGSGDVFFVRGNDTRFATLEDLNKPNVKVAILTGSASESDRTVLTRADFVSLPNVPTSILVAQVLAGKADAFATSSYLGPALIQQYHFKTIPDIASNPDGVLNVPLAWAIPKGEPEFLNQLNTFLNMEMRNGTISALKKQWLTVDNSLKG